MGERAAQRTNKMLDKFSGMYVGKNFGYSRTHAEAHERIFGGRRSEGAAGEEEHRPPKDIIFGDGPLGMEIVWSDPPVVIATAVGGAAQRAGVEAGDQILEINGADISGAAEFDLDEVVRERPLRLLLARAPASGAATSSGAEGGTSPALPAQAAVRRQGVSVVPGVLGRKRCEELGALVLAERDRSAAAATSAEGAELFSPVRTARAAPGAPETRWDLRLPMTPGLRGALEELLWSPAEGAGLGPAFAALAGGDAAELWELGAVVSEPGAAMQPLHFDAPERCLYTAFVALQDVTPQMGPTIFLTGTNSPSAHRSFEADPAAFVASASRSGALLGAGDAAVYDSRVLHCGGSNRSDTRRILIYITFRDPSVDPAASGVEQHSLREELKGCFRLGDFRIPPAGGALSAP